MFKKFTGIVLIVFTLSAVESAHAVESVDDATIIGINIVIQSLIGAIGAAIHGKSFFKGLRNGALGGAVIATGKFMVGRSYQLAWPSKLTVALGSSMVENTARGQELFSTLGFDVGPLYFSWQRVKTQYKFRTDFMIGPSVVLIKSMAETDRFDWEASLMTGTPVFLKDDLGENWAGLAYGNTIWLKTKYARHPTVLSHELIHTYQYSSYAAGGAVFIDLFGVNEVYRKLHLRVEEDVGNFLFAYPETQLMPYLERPHEREAYGLTDLR